MLPTISDYWAICERCAQEGAEPPTWQELEDDCAWKELEDLLKAVNA